MIWTSPQQQLVAKHLLRVLFVIEPANTSTPLLAIGPSESFSSPQYPCIEFERSSAICGSGETSLIYRHVTYREQMNTITSYIDASGIYGSTEEDAYNLRNLSPDQGLLRYW
ncbi:hypothetical protein WUBG_18511, partial [Wuchereria bancrofti]